MATAAPSILSLTAAGLYLVVLAVCVAAFLVARKFNQAPSHWRAWALIATGFLLLAAIRLTGFEDAVRAALREMLALVGTYEARRSFQRPLAAGLLATITAAAALGLLRQWRLTPGRRNLAVVVGLAGLAIMFMILGVRIVSLHQLDTLLYGPAKLNWIIDLGASLVVMGAAAIYIREVSQRP